MNAPDTALQGQDTAVIGRLYMAFELGERSWKLSLSDAVLAPSRYTLAVGDTKAVLNVIAKAKARCQLATGGAIRSCYEAGRDGFWLHRWFMEQGIRNLVVDSASIEANRRARRAKTNRLDADKLLSMLMRYHAGERRVGAVARTPTPEQEDERRLHRELERLSQERTAHINRIRLLLILHHVRVAHVDSRFWKHCWTVHGSQLRPGLRAEIEREVARLALAVAQIKTIEAQQHEDMKTGWQPAIAMLARLSGIGVRSAWVLTKELFGWRRFHRRREVAGCLGLTPTPYSSGESQVDQGISKVGNKRSRWLMIAPAWSWLRYQPTSQLTQWFNARFASNGKRMLRVGIVAPARRLAVALLRYLEYGEVAAEKPPTLSGKVLFINSA